MSTIHDTSFAWANQLMMTNNLQFATTCLDFVEQVLLVRVTPSPLWLSSLVQNGISAGASLQAHQFH